MGTWRKSSYSSATGGSCVEVADDARTVMVRDTKQEDMGDARIVLSVPDAAWSAFLGTLR